VPSAHIRPFPCGGSSDCCFSLAYGKMTQTKAQAFGQSPRARRTGSIKPLGRDDIVSRYATKWFAVAAFLITVGAVAALSHAAEAEISLSNAWVRPTLGAGRTTAAYVTVTNAGTAADRLTAVDTPGANSVEVHTAGMEEGIMRMRRLDGLDIRVGETGTIAPGGYHSHAYVFGTARGCGNYYSPHPHIRGGRELHGRSPRRDGAPEST